MPNFRQKHRDVGVNIRNSSLDFKVHPQGMGVLHEESPGRVAPPFSVWFLIISIRFLRRCPAFERAPHGIPKDTDGSISAYV